MTMITLEKMDWGAVLFSKMFDEFINFYTYFLLKKIYDSAKKGKTSL